MCSQTHHCSKDIYSVKYIYVAISIRLLSYVSILQRTRIQKIKLLAFYMETDTHRYTANMDVQYLPRKAQNTNSISAF